MSWNLETIGRVWCFFVSRPEVDRVEMNKKRDLGFWFLVAGVSKPPSLKVTDFLQEEMSVLRNDSSGCFAPKIEVVETRFHDADEGEAKQGVYM